MARAALLPPLQYKALPAKARARTAKLAAEKKEQTRKSGGGVVSSALISTLALPLVAIRASRNASTNAGISAEDDMAAIADSAVDVAKAAAIAGFGANFVVGLAKAAATVTAAAAIGPAFKIFAGFGALSMAGDGNASAAAMSFTTGDYRQKVWINGTHFIFKDEMEMQQKRLTAEVAQPVLVYAATSSELKEEKEMVPSQWRGPALVETPEQAKQRLGFRREELDQQRSRLDDLMPSLQSNYRNRMALQGAEATTTAVTPSGITSDGQRLSRFSPAASPSDGRTLTQRAIALRLVLGYLSTATLASALLCSGYAAIAGPAAAAAAARRLAPKMAASSAALAAVAAVGWGAWRAGGAWVARRGSRLAPTQADGGP